jgi:hypothetical protein
MYRSIQPRLSMIAPIAKCAIEGLASTKRASSVKSVALPSTITTVLCCRGGAIADFLGAGR